MGEMARAGVLLAALELFAAGCAHETQARSAVGTSPLAPFDDVNLPHPTSREQLAAALRDRGFLPATDSEGAQLGGALRAFQQSEGLAQTGWPDDETLRRLGMDPRTKDRTLDPAPVWRPGSTGAGVSH